MSQLPIVVLKVKYPLRFVVSYVQPVAQYCESRTVGKAPLQSKLATMKNMDDFHYGGPGRHASHTTSKLTFFTVSKDEWDTKG